MWYFVKARKGVFFAEEVVSVHRKVWHLVKTQRSAFDSVGVVIVLKSRVLPCTSPYSP